ncbi:MAG: branched-chain amino acid ABC transporter permease [Deltaproteobacteria bacterium]|nr:branched-chain amino acid ABC transporter permease [Deltaproteobacteria bacterium]
MDRKKLLIAALAISLLLAPLFLPDFWISVFISVMAMMVLSTGFRMIYTTGRLSLGHTFPVGIGAYVSALLSSKLGISFWWGLLLGGIAAGLIALLVGYVVLRIGGIYFVVITLAMSEVLIYLLLWAEPFTGGVDGVVNIQGPAIYVPMIGRFEFGYKLLPYYYLIFLIMLVSVGIMYLMEKSHIGRVFHALRQNDLLAEHVGINVTSYRVLAFVTASVFAGFVGSFMAHYHHYTCPDDFHVMESLFIQIYAFIGGIGSFFGAIVGPMVIMSISEVFRVAKEAQPLLYAGMMLVVMMWLPGGLVTIPAMLKKWRMKKT